MSANLSRSWVAAAVVAGAAMLVFAAYRDASLREQMRQERRARRARTKQSVRTILEAMRHE